MALGEAELRVHIEVALEAGGGILAGVHDESSTSAAGLDMFAGWPMAGLAASHAREADIIPIQFAVRAGGKNARDIGVTLDARAVSNVIGSLDLGRGNDGAIERGARNDSSKSKQSH
jgi:hypothetical protein